MARRKKDVDADATVEADEVETDEVETDAAVEKPKRVQEPLDPAKLKPEAAEHLAKGSEAKRTLEVAAKALEILGLEGAAKRSWKEAERAFKAAEREARKIQRAGGKEAREAAKKEKKKARIAKLREQLEKLMAAEEAEG